MRKWSNGVMEWWSGGIMEYCCKSLPAPNLIRRLFRGSGGVLKHSSDRFITSNLLIQARKKETSFLVYPELVSGRRQESPSLLKNPKILRLHLLPYLLLTLSLASWTTLQAHEIRPAYLEITQTNETNYNILWKIPKLGNRIPRISPTLPNGFELSDPETKQLIDAQIQQFTGTYKKPVNGKKLSIEGLPLTLIDVFVKINLVDETAYTFLLQPDKPTTTIPTEPNAWQVAKLYIELGIEHILIGIDHLLFVLGLLLLVGGIMPLVKTVTAFTIAHSITLALAALDIVRVPQAPVEAVIALSIVFLAREYLMYKRDHPSLTAEYPWLVAFIFGLLHGFGFAGVLQEIGFPQKDIPLALFTFNAGVEIGQLLFIGVLLVIYAAFKKTKIQLPTWSWKILPYGMGTMAMCWLIERVMGF